MITKPRPIPSGILTIKLCPRVSITCMFIIVVPVKVGQHYLHALSVGRCV